MTAALHDETGKPLRDGAAATKDDPNCEHCPAMTVGHLIAKALSVPDKDVPPDELWARGALAARLREDRAATLTNDEIGAIKKAVGKNFPSPVIIMQLWPVIDPTAKPAAVRP
jgi:hypothetical protein